MLGVTSLLLGTLRGLLVTTRCFLQQTLVTTAILIVGYGSPEMETAIEQQLQSIKKVGLKHQGQQLSESLEFDIVV